MEDKCNVPDSLWDRTCSSLQLGCIYGQDSEQERTGLDATQYCMNSIWSASLLTFAGDLSWFQTPERAWGPSLDRWAIYFSEPEHTLAASLFVLLPSDSSCFRLQTSSYIWMITSLFIAFLKRPQLLLHIFRALKCFMQGAVTDAFYSRINNNSSWKNQQMFPSYCCCHYGCSH